jgi:hypothetical protein
VTAETWVSTALAGLLFLGLIVLTVADWEGPKCPCGCGRTPSEHNPRRCRLGRAVAGWLLAITLRAVRP